MNNLDRMSGAILQFLNDAIRVVLEGAAWLEAHVRGLLAGFDIGPKTQSLIMLLVLLAVVMIVVRVFGGLLRIVLVVALLVVLAEAIIPAVREGAPDLRRPPTSPAPVTPAPAVPPPAAPAPGASPGGPSRQ